MVQNYSESQNKSTLISEMFFSSCALTVIPMFGALNSNFLTHVSFIAIGTAVGAIFTHILALIFPKYESALQSEKFEKSLFRSTR